MHQLSQSAFDEVEPIAGRRGRPDENGGVFPAAPWFWIRYARKNVAKIRSANCTASTEMIRAIYETMNWTPSTGQGELRWTPSTGQGERFSKWSLLQ